MKKTMARIYHSLIKLMKIRGKYFLISLSFLTLASETYACTGSGTAINALTFVSSFLMVTIAITTLAFMIWLVRKALHRETSWYLLLCISSVVVTIFLGVLGSFIVPQFKTLYEAFGADLPKQTVILLRSNHLLWLPLGGVAGLWYVTKSNRYKVKYFLITLFVSVILLVSVIWALYSPIFKMGEPC